MSVLDEMESLQRIDRSGMLSRVAALPDQCLEGWHQGLSWRVPASYGSSDQLFVLGMGGSAIGADILQGILADKTPKPVIINRTYTIPQWVGKKTLALASSYSGNTEETLAGARLAQEQGARLLAITSGGLLADWALHSRFPLSRIPPGLPPRSALGYMAFVPLGLLVRLGWVKKRDLPVERACRGLKKFIHDRLVPSVPTSSNPAKKTALSLVGRLPVLYGAAGGWEGITYRWRTQFEENSKCLAFHHIFPEATHNEISAWLKPRFLMSKSTAIFLTDPAVHPRSLRRMEFTKRTIQGEGVKVLTLSVPGSSLLERMLNLIALGDFISVYLGILYRIDPTPVKRVEALKKYMSGPKGARGV